MQEVQVLGCFLALQPFAFLLRLVRELFSHELEVAIGELLLLLNWQGLQNGVSHCKDVCTHANLAPTLAFTPEIVRVCLAPYKGSHVRSTRRRSLLRKNTATLATSARHPRLLASDQYLVNIINIVSISGRYLAVSKISCDIMSYLDSMQ